MTPEQEQPKLLHIYGQVAWHDDAEVVGNRPALTELLRMLQEVLGQPNDATYRDDFWVNDGEGYGVKVRMVEGGWDSPTWTADKMAAPYSADYAQGRAKELDSYTLGVVADRLEKKDWFGDKLTANDRLKVLTWIRDGMNKRGTNCLLIK